MFQCRLFRMYEQFAAMGAPVLAVLKDAVFDLSWYVGAFFRTLSGHDNPSLSFV